MEDLYFSFVIPVYNRPDEVEELLQSLVEQDYQKPYEIVLVEDGSTLDSKTVVEAFKSRLNISYYFKENSGPGDSRNYGMRNAKGNYFLILDSDCILPPQYLTEVQKELGSNFVHCFGGPDAAHESFSDIQKAINYAMTSFLTTGGIRGRKNAVGKFQPRSFNLGISKEAFDKTKGFGNIHPGEDPDLTFRIWKAGYETRLFPKAFVFHKRRIDWKKYHKQVNKFGMVRPILNKWHPSTKKITYWFPTFFVIGFILAVIVSFFKTTILLWLYALYFGVLFMECLFTTKSFKISMYALLAVVIQFWGYGKGFLKSTLFLTFSSKEPQEIFPHLFFKN
ncbi:glycosyl transferase family 2 [Croceivirga lutea]|uniref:glycosyltransferase n=1 Tax=Croceivirga lutea TaxID=1775167 RepID=UPI00163A1CC1|nr:glycosyltransferase [Croceivirga lutea]GGG46880.1 glycosyl transferase family 2 [Croceivirga lutea]